MADLEQGKKYLMRREGDPFWSRDDSEENLLLEVANYNDGNGHHCQVTRESLNGLPEKIIVSRTNKVPFKVKRVRSSRIFKGD